MNPRDYPHYYAKRERDNTHFHFSFLVTSKELFILSRKKFFWWILTITHSGVPQPLAPQNQYASSPYCSPHISEGADNKNLFNNQEFL